MARAIVEGSDLAFEETGVVTGGQTIREGMPVMFVGATLQEAVAQADIAVGIAVGMENQAPVGAAAWTALAGSTVRYVRLGSPCVVKCRVGAGGATIHLRAVCAAAGAQNYALAAGANVTTILGTWQETGVVNELRGLYVGDACCTLGA